MNGQAPSPTKPHEPGDRRERTRLALLGVNAWVVAVLVPTLHVGVGGLSPTLAGLAPLAVLAVGVASMRGNVARARWTLLGAFPGSIAMAMALRVELTERDVYGTLGLLVAVGALLAFTAAAAHAAGRDRAAKPSQTQVIVGKEPLAEPASRRLLRRALLVLAGAGALAIAVLGPTLSSRRERVRVWGDAADDATVLTAIVAAIVATLALATAIGPALRAARARSDHPTQSRRRLAASMLIATAAGVGWLVLRHFEHG